MSAEDTEPIDDLVKDSIVAGDSPSEWRERKEEELPEDYEPSPRERTIEASYTEMLVNLEEGRSVDEVAEYLEHNLATQVGILDRIEDIDTEYDDSTYGVGLFNWALGDSDRDKIDRRGFLKDIGGVAILGVAGVGAYGAWDDNQTGTNGGGGQETEVTVPENEEVGWEVAKSYLKDGQESQIDELLDDYGAEPDEATYLFEKEDTMTSANGEPLYDVVARFSYKGEKQVVGLDNVDLVDSRGEGR